MINAFRLPDAITIRSAGNENMKLPEKCLFTILENVIIKEYAAIMPISLTFVNSLSIRSPADIKDLIVLSP